MPTKAQMIIRLPQKLADAVSSRVASGEYASEEEFVCESILLHIDEARGTAPVLSDEWLVQHALPALDELNSDPSTGMSHEDLLATLSDSHTSDFAKAS